MINHTRVKYRSAKGSREMAIYRIQLVDGEKSVKTDLKAVNEDSARMFAEKWFDGAHWRVVGIRRVAE
jgi:hypothetical protein